MVLMVTSLRTQSLGGNDGSTHPKKVQIFTKEKCPIGGVGRGMGGRWWCSPSSACGQLGIGDKIERTESRSRGNVICKTRCDARKVLKTNKKILIMMTYNKEQNEFCGGGLQYRLRGIHVRGGTGAHTRTTSPGKGLGRVGGRLTSSACEGGRAPRGLQFGIGHGSYLIV